MSNNEGGLDRAIRIVLGIALIGAFFAFPDLGAWRWALWIGIVPLLTGAVGWCPLYAIFGLSTCPMKRA